MLGKAERERRGGMSLFDIAVGVFEEKMKASVSAYVQGIVDKKKVAEIFDELCAGQEGRALFENQGAVEGIDFYVLTNTLREELIENALAYYSEDNRKKAEDTKQRLFEEVQVQTGAVTKEQKRAVCRFLDHVYGLTGVYLRSCLGKEDQLAIIISDNNARQQIDMMHERIRDEIKELIAEQKSDKAWELPLCDFRAYNQRQKNSNGVYRLLEINDGLFPALSAWDGVQYSNENGELVPLFSCLAEKREIGQRKHLLLIGAGGMGKTVSLLRLWDKLLEERTCAVYIPLHEIMNAEAGGSSDGEAIKRFMTENVFSGDTQKMGQFVEYLSKSAGKPALVLLLDGFNEVSADSTRAAVQAVKKWMLYPGVQVVISSRYDFRKNIAVEDLNELTIEPLSEQQMQRWFDLCEMPFPKENKKLYELLKTPFMLTLYTQVESRYSQGKEAVFVQWMEPVNTSGSLMWNFMQCQILKMANELLRPGVDILQAVIASVYILPYLCWKMEWRELFTVGITDLNQWVEEAAAFYQNRWKRYPEERVQILTLEFGTIKWDSNDFIRILTKELNLMVNRGGASFSLLHQNFRDFLAAVHLNRAVEMNSREMIAETWERRPFSDNVVGFLSEWMTEPAADGMFESLRGAEIPEGNYVFYNLVRVIREMKADDLSGTDFSDMDLRTVRLNGARLVDGTHRACFRRARISYGTLIMQGHCDRIYHVAFSEDGRQLISVSAMEIRIWDLMTGSCIHEITEGAEELGGYFEYNRQDFYKSFVTADGREFVWIGENDTCRGRFEDSLAWFLRCDDSLKRDMENSNWHYSHTREQKLEMILTHQTAEKKVDIQEDKLTVTLPSGDIRELSGNQAMASCANLSRDQKYCAAGLFDGSICIWDLESGRRIRELPKSVHRISFFEEYAGMMIGQTSGIVMIWEADYKVCTYVLEGRRSPVTLICIDGDICSVSHEDGVAEIWSLSENRILKTIENQQCVSVSVDEKIVCGKTLDGTVWYENWETKEKKTLWTGVEKDRPVICYGSEIYKWDDSSMRYCNEQFRLKDQNYYRYYRGPLQGEATPSRFECHHNLIVWSYMRRPETRSIYTIINLNLFGCDFAEADFETLELAAKVKSNGGVLELPEKYHTRMFPWMYGGK